MSKMMERQVERQRKSYCCNGIIGEVEKYLRRKVRKQMR